MAGHLPFMRGRLTTLDAVGPGMIAGFGVPLADEGRTDLAPMAMRETSAYFGSHFSANMKSAMDIDERRCLRSAAIAGSVVDLGDLVAEEATGLFDGPVRMTVARICRSGAIPLLLGGDARCIAPAIAGLRDGRPDASGVAALLIGAIPGMPGLRDGDAVATLNAAVAEDQRHRRLAVTFRDMRRSAEDAARSVLAHLGSRPVHVALDASAIASHWHATSPAARFDGLGLAECRSFLRRLGGADIATLSITGLDPTLNGLSLVKSGQRLMLTAILDLIYARLGVLEPRMELADG
jgi:agmatinase